MSCSNERRRIHGGAEGPASAPRLSGRQFLRRAGTGGATPPPHASAPLCHCPAPYVCAAGVGAWIAQMEALRRGTGDGRMGDLGVTVAPGGSAGREIAREITPPSARALYVHHAAPTVRGSLRRQAPPSPVPSSSAAGAASGLAAMSAAAPRTAAGRLWARPPGRRVRPARDDVTVLRCCRAATRRRDLRAAAAREAVKT